MGTKKLMLWIFSIAIQNMYIYKGHRREMDFFSKGAWPHSHLQNGIFSELPNIGHYASS